ncbi:MAG: hypothetical protein K0Q71_4632 [Thermomicrobiales bacterium]|jgi:hypothetical protein|nr:hypothetical protein [Thermomicrobiales bacterium]
MSEPKPGTIDAGLLRDLAALVGVELGEERGKALVSQAEPHFAQLRELDAVAVPTTEPAAAFRLDDRVSRDRD